MVTVVRLGALVSALAAVLFLSTAAPAQTTIAQTTIAPIAAYVVLGPGGERIARVVTEIKDCPALFVDGRVMEMHVRAAAGTSPLRPTASKPEFSKPSAFPATTCEAVIPPIARQASVHGWILPLPPETVRRIVVIGDTGCRIKAADNAAQACGDANAYPFAAIAAAAAAWKPDLVLHVGDYLYRETPCPADKPGCAGGAWGYGLDSWRADFLDPAGPLLRVAPWAMVRGNHESCDRGGQGWQRFFDPYPLTPERTCDDPADDAAGSFSDPFAIPLGDGSQIVIWDTASAGNGTFSPADPRRAAYLANVRRIAALAKAVPHTILANHHPVLAIAGYSGPMGLSALVPSNRSLIEVLAEADPALYAPGIDLLLSGHIHVWEQLSFGGRFPSQLVTGFSGTQEDSVPLPETLPPDIKTAAGTSPDSFSSWVDGFGYMTMERVGAADWNAEIHDQTGAVVNRCAIRGRISHCDVRQVRAK